MFSLERIPGSFLVGQAEMLPLKVKFLKPRSNSKILS